MTVPLSQMVWAVSVLDYCPNVQVLGMSIDADPWVRPDGRVYVAEVHVHVGGWTDAKRVAGVLRLTETEGRTSEGYSGMVMGWRKWSGWVPDGSRDLPVRVEVTAAEVIADARQGVA
jgi:hypothetical protein